MKKKAKKEPKSKKVPKDKKEPKTKKEPKSQILSIFGLMPKQKVG